METLGSTYAKAIDDLSAKIFVPAITCSLLSEFGGFFVQHLGLVWGYLAAFSLGIFIAFLILGVIIFIDYSLNYKVQTKSYLGNFLMPLGLIGLFPDYFIGITPPYTQVTAVALLAWSFVLIKPLESFQHYLEMRHK